MSKVSITRSLLDTLANSISTKSGVAVPMTLAEMNTAVNSITPVTSGMWLPPSAVLVSSATETLNLSTDTSYDSWTPSTTNTAIKSAGSTRAACNYSITTDYQDTALIGLCVANTVIAYPEGTTFAAGYALTKTVFGICHYAPVHVQNYPSSDYYGMIATSTSGFQSYYSSSSETSVYHSASYGIGWTGVSWGASSSTSTSSRNVGFTRAAIYARCRSTNFTTASAAALDSANTDIIFTYKIYKIDKTESPLYKAFDAENGIFFT